MRTAGRFIGGVIVGIIIGVVIVALARPSALRAQQAAEHKTALGCYVLPVAIQAGTQSLLNDNAKDGWSVVSVSLWPSGVGVCVLAAFRKP